MATQEEQFLHRQQRQNVPFIGGAGGSSSGSLSEGIIGISIFGFYVYVLYKLSPYYWSSMEYLANLFDTDLYFLPIPLAILLVSLALIWIIIFELKTNKEWILIGRFFFRATRVVLVLSFLPAVLFSGFQTLIIVLFYNPFF